MDAPDPRFETLERLCAMAGQRLGAERAESARQFMRLLYANVPPDDLAGLSDDALYASALSLLGLGRTRQPGTPSIRIYNPDLQEHGWTSPHTVIEIVNDDMPFLVDSVTNALNRQDVTVHLVIHPIVAVQRDDQGVLQRMRATDEPSHGDAGAEDDGDWHHESFMHVEIDELTAQDQLAAIRGVLDAVLADVRAAVDDWRAMLERVDALIAELDERPPPLDRAEVGEGLNFLRWLKDDHFTFLGYREYAIESEGDEVRLDVTADSGLGTLRDPEITVFQGRRDVSALPAEVQDFIRQPKLVLVSKGSLIATVHRNVLIDTVSFKTFDAQGRVTGERLFAGLFTSRAYAESPKAVPVLAAKVAEVLRRSGLRPRSHDYKALENVLETFPRDELFQIGVRDLERIATGILHLQERQRTALFVRRDPYERFVSCFVYTPRDRYGSELRATLGEILARAYNGRVRTWQPTLRDDSVLARVHYIVETEPGQIPEVDQREVEAHLIEASRSWSDRLRDALVAELGEEKGLTLHRRYGEGFPTAYRERFNPEMAIADVVSVDAVLEGSGFDMSLYRPVDADERSVHLKLYQAGRPVHLSDILPRLENMGAKTLSEVPFEVHDRDSASVWLHDFQLVRYDGEAINVSDLRGRFKEAFHRVWHGEVEDDGFNALVVNAGLTWRDVVVLRAFARYLRQAAIPFSQTYMEQTLARHARMTGLILELFRYRFDPRRQGTNAEANIHRLHSEITNALDAVDSLDEDRILRRFVNLVEAAVRTNAFQTGPDGAPKGYLSFKFDSRRIDDLPLPRPAFEIFVYSPRMEGVHLRGGKVARGGIRWSDRREDFRTEVLGLMKAQMVKNAVIVPVGSKGGFVVKRPPAPSGDPAADREAARAEGVACYKTLMRGLLDITDNRVEGEIRPPVDVVRRDDDDPYLVVAADKGTATFSDIANGVSAEYGFWLGDAFASGGSAGYDHKAMGITARGGWEAVKRHFREIGVDIQSQDFTVIGIGDMSGDVFGNGMLLSRHIRLVAAFNHLHIFVDPEPDAAASFEERQRLFELPRSSWADYDPALLSQGGRIYERRAKTVDLTPEIQARFGLAESRVAPNALIRAILRAQADLMWFGGIGTYVKAAQESHGDVGDRANDAIRIDGRELDVRVVGEGANLGCTQLGRVEFALRGGRINTDAIDNSGGVDCSDHEVNIKILLDEVVEGGDMTLKQRNALLSEMTEDVAAHVLNNNYMQTLALSVAERQGGRALEGQARLIRTLERAGTLDRSIEFLPDEDEIAARLATNRGLTRPELAVLLAYAKNTLYTELLGSGLPDDEQLFEDLRRYFPKQLYRRFPDTLAAHPLRREIIATFVTNSIVNRAGPTFVNELTGRCGAAPEDVARAYAVARDVFDLRPLWTDISALDNQVPAQTQYDMLLRVHQLVDHATGWFIEHEAQPLDIKPIVDAFHDKVQTLWSALTDVLTASGCAGLSQRSAVLQEAGVSEALADRIAGLPPLAAASDIVRIHDACGGERPITDTARTYFALGERLGLEWLRVQATAVEAEDAWEQRAIGALLGELYEHQAGLAAEVVHASEDRAPDEAVAAWSERRATAIRRTDELITELQRAGGVDLAMLSVATRQFGHLAAQSG